MLREIITNPLSYRLQKKPKESWMYIGVWGIGEGAVLKFAVPQK